MEALKDGHTRSSNRGDLIPSWSNYKYSDRITVGYCACLQYLLLLPPTQRKKTTVYQGMKPIEHRHWHTSRYCYTDLTHIDIWQSSRYYYHYYTALLLRPSLVVSMRHSSYAFAWESQHGCARPHTHTHKTTHTSTMPHNNIGSNVHLHFYMNSCAQQCGCFLIISFSRCLLSPKEKTL